MIADHLPPRPLCDLSAACRAFHALLDKVCMARFTAAATGVVSGFVMCYHCNGGCCRVPASKSDYDRALKLLGQAAALGCTGVVMEILELPQVPSDGMDCGGPSPLMRAMLGGHVETVRSLLEAGAQVPVLEEKDVKGARAAEMEELLAEYRGRVGV